MQASNFSEAQWGQFYTVISTVELIPSPILDHIWPTSACVHFFFFAGTVVVQPEAVQEKTIRFRGPEFKSSNKKAGGGRRQKL